MALIMSLFSDAEMKGLGSVPLPHASSVGAGMLEPIGSASSEIVNPCVSCELAGVCSNDECAQLGFPVDMPFPPTRFRNLGEYINLLKHYGWI